MYVKYSSIENNYQLENYDSTLKYYVLTIIDHTNFGKKSYKEFTFFLGLFFYRSPRTASIIAS